MPPQTQTQRRRRTGNNDNTNEARRRRQSRHKHESDDSEASEEDQDGDVDMEKAGDGTDDQLVRKLVRYALACEYARISIKRDGIRDKVLGSNTRSFKRVFEGAQAQLQQVFGMEMVELPVKEKRTLKEKQRANARKAASQSTASSRQYILVSTLPPGYKSQSIIAPSRIPSTSEEAAYVGFYTMVISLIVLNGGELSDTKLRRYLTRLNASQNLPMDKTDNVLQKIVRQGYVDKVVEKSDGDEDAVTWCIGSRGRVEVPPESIAAVITEVWGELPDDFHTKLQRSLGIQELQQGLDESAIPEE
ncbi:Non-structural maintenance of chromosome element 3 [Daldinia childiae]|uniref:Non-structural maintenance of chromosome element 3 n=1 Tax=Daldinia childiae TaxID=326645 RepID=UPI001446287D|nr:Non-structural maintenance of chromosome element 3 [Daldinia childiae]KAF3062091.1 Non-structural maintenance of chromosome element 3 [Daldinia childiae]